jgi:hypothetical protein
MRFCLAVHKDAANSEVERVPCDDEYFIPRFDCRTERRERLARALIEGEKSGLSGRSVRDIVASAKSIVTAERDVTGS